MRGLGVLGVGTACLMGLGLAVGSRAGEPPSGGGGKSAAVRPGGGSSGRKTTEDPARAAAEEDAQARKREEAAYLRRVAVCDKLAQIGFQTNDGRLQEAAEQLQRRAFEVYMQRIAHLPASHADGLLDEELLQRYQDAASPAGTRLEEVGRKGPGTKPLANAWRLPGRGR
jgi:hypothetical protein